jgi:hypothetical protein
MPKYMERRVLFTTCGRVLPRDLQAALGRKEIWKSLGTKELPEAKRRLHIELVRFDEWVRSLRMNLAETRQMGPANELPVMVRCSTRLGQRRSPIPARPISLLPTSLLNGQGAGSS